MDHLPQRQAFFLAPVARDVGLTSAALGLVQALRRDGIKAGFAKPILQPYAVDGAADLSSYFARDLLHLDVPKPIPFAEAEARVRTGEIEALLEDLVAAVEAARAGCDVVVVEGLIPDVDHQVAARLNAAMARSLSTSLVPVMSGTYVRQNGPAEGVQLALRQYGEGSSQTPAIAGVLVNKLQDLSQVAALRERLGATHLLGAVPFAAELDAPRLADLVQSLGLAVEQEGELSRARVREVVVCGRGVEGVIDRLKPGALVVAAGERSDIALAAGLAWSQGTPLAGLLLTCGTKLTPQVAAMLRSDALAGLPILITQDDTFATGTRLAAAPRQVTANDAERMSGVIAHVAEHIDTAPLRDGLGQPGRLRMPPPAFRHRLVEAARAADRRIVLPEGDEPRTLQAAAICARKGIARPVLLGDPVRIRHVAQVQGVELPPAVEIVDAAAVRHRYVAEMVERRRGKGLTPIQAEHELEDNVVLGTMMLALDEVDGLVSGAVHTTANTIRPALQLIRTAPGSSIVSSVFFMLMPDEVLVYGDCAVNPDPTAEELADIAIQSADSAAAFGIEPRVAMISYSTGTSGSGADVEKVRRALEIARGQRPDLLIDGPMQYDAASVESVGLAKAPGSKVAGRASVFVFPDLNTGNTTYKAVQRSAGVVSVGPMLQGLRKPVNDLSRGALVDDIVYTIALTAIQATQVAPREEALLAAE